MEIKPYRYDTYLYRHDTSTTHELPDPLSHLVRRVQLHSFIRYYGLRNPLEGQLKWRINRGFGLQEFEF